MIHTANQLKDKVRNLSGSDSDIAQTLIRNYMMERFLERISLSEYKNNFILKGGMLVASLVGINIRATMDIDTTVKALPINEADSKRIVEEICKVPLDDGITFKIMSTKRIMQDFDYPGIRIKLEAGLGRLRQPIKIDISTDDAITPDAIEYEYKLMFEDRSISLLTYNLETLLSEKIQTMVNRGLTNTRLRDFYDIYEVLQVKGDQIDTETLKDAFSATCNKRQTIFDGYEINNTLNLICNDEGMAKLWENYKEDNYFVGELDWNEVSNVVADYIKVTLETNV